MQSNCPGLKPFAYGLLVRGLKAPARSGKTKQIPCVNDEKKQQQILRRFRSSDDKSVIEKRVERRLNAGDERKHFGDAGGDLPEDTDFGGYAGNVAFQLFQRVVRNFKLRL